MTGSPDWRLRLVGEAIELDVKGRTHRATIDGASPLHCRRGLFWSDLALADVRVDGLPNDRAKALEAAVAVVLADQWQRAKQDAFRNGHAQVQEWLAETFGQMKLAQDRRRWLTHEQQQSLLEKKAALSIDIDALQALCRDPDIRAACADNLESIETHLRAWQGDWQKAWSDLNEEHVARELVACKEVFDSVESRPLTEEQARAVICFDNRVQLIASAGSGKTSTMVAKAAYAIHRGLVKPERIVLLAFNKQAADELSERVGRALGRLGMPDVEVQASTFHALGLRIIGKATGRKPDIPAWAVDTVEGLQKLTEIIDRLKDGSVGFRTRWDLFRLVFARDLPAFGASSDPDGWDRDGNGYMRTLRGERVRSQEECLIADWLFYSGVNYEYERRYEFDTATETHRQYSPDFYYPDIRLYHEHLALNASGQAPPAFVGYVEGVEWKRQLHRQNGTDLIETTSHQMREGTMFDHLAQALTGRGIVLDPDPDRASRQGSQNALQNSDLIRLVRTFISHAKSNGLTPQALQQRLSGLAENSFRIRYRMFLDIMGPVMAGWDDALAREGGIDFEDMLNLAAGHLEQGRGDPGYALVMADEFQDASRARARLCRALVGKPGRHLFAVGDDWQSINRFAGADMSVMTRFQEWFGHSQVLKLEQTFRCPQALCDISSRFVCSNPRQIGKAVRSATPSPGPVLEVIQVDKRDKLQGAIVRFLNGLSRGLRGGAIASGRNGKVSVFILGRYNADRAYVPDGWKARYGDCIELSFLTMHRSKGSEADYVILPAMLAANRGLGFPNTREDDPVLSLVMPQADDFPYAEERRLFYVALTRARRSVAMFTVAGARSPFLVELVQSENITVTDIEGDAVEERVCPVCRQGAIVLRTGPYGEFQACSNYPRCEHKPRGAVGPIARRQPARSSPARATGSLRKARRV